jgi:hypothetical protein
MERTSLTETFNKFGAAHPGLATHARPLNMGAFGLVLENRDGSLTNILFDHEAGHMRAKVREFLKTETGVLRAFTARPPAAFDVPVLLKEPDYFGGGDYLAAYTMTRLPGACACWYGDMEKDAAAYNARHYESAGRTLAKLHREVAALPEQALGERLLGYCTKIDPVPEFSIETARAFAAVNRYMQPRLKPAVVHGDYHGGNLMVDENGEVTGVLDFALTGRCGNHLVDFMAVPSGGFADFLRGYERESGETVDRHMMDATMLSMWVECYNRPGPVGDLQEFHAGKIRETLKKLEPVIRSF